MNAQTPFNKPLRINFNEEETQYMEFAALAQFWLRSIENNPGSTVNGVVQKRNQDAFIRRLRLVNYAKLSDRVSFHIILGLNDLSTKNRSGGAIRLLDMVAEYQLAPEFSLGIGKTAYSGFSRYSSPHPATQLGFDIPVFALPTVNISDDLSRNLGIFAKGKAGKIDYRFALTKPYDAPASDINNGNAVFTSGPSKWQYSSYLKLELLESESQKYPYMAGTYLGKKKVLTLGVGFRHHPSGMTARSSTGNDILHDITLYAVDLFYESPSGPNNGAAWTAYLGFFNYNMGPDFIRLIGINNPAYEANEETSFNGVGHQFPIIGSGQIWYTQVGYLFPTANILGQFQPFFAWQYADYDRLDDKMSVIECGINWYLKGPESKFTLGYQNRPVFEDQQGATTSTDRGCQWILQYNFILK